MNSQDNCKGIIVNGFTTRMAGTSLQGYMPQGTTYAQIKEKLGEPIHYSDLDGKVQVEWIIEFENGVVATIYDWKEAIPYPDVKDWNIGGNCLDAVAEVYALFDFEFDEGPDSHMEPCGPGNYWK